MRRQPTRRAAAVIAALACSRGCTRWRTAQTARPTTRSCRTTPPTRRRTSSRARSSPSPRSGSTMVAVGTFTTVTAPGGRHVHPPHQHLRVRRHHRRRSAPRSAAVQRRRQPGRVGRRRHVGLRRWQVQPAQRRSRCRKVVRLDVTTGQHVPGFKAPAINGAGLRHGPRRTAGSTSVARSRRSATSVKSGLVALDPATGNDTQQITASFADTPSTAARSPSRRSTWRPTVATWWPSATSGRSTVRVVFRSPCSTPTWRRRPWRRGRRRVTPRPARARSTRTCATCPSHRTARTSPWSTTGAFAGGVGLRDPVRRRHPLGVPARRGRAEPDLGRLHRRRHAVLVSCRPGGRSTSVATSAG